MGIKGLLKTLKDISITLPLKKFRCKKIGVDIYGWLYDIFLRHPTMVFFGIVDFGGMKRRTKTNGLNFYSRKKVPSFPIWLRW